MAGSTRGKGTRNTKKSTTKSRSSRSNKKVSYSVQDMARLHEIELIVLFVIFIILFLCNFGLIGSVGAAISSVQFGLFGLTAYIAPMFLFFVFAFAYVNAGNMNAIIKLIAACVLFIVAGVVCELFSKEYIGQVDSYSAKALYHACSEAKKGGGIIAGSLAYFLHHYLETVGTVLVILLLTAICLIILTEKSLLAGVKKGGSKLRDIGIEDYERRKEYAEYRRQEIEEQRLIKEEQRRLREEQRQQKEEERRIREEERRLREEELENEKILRMEKKVSGVMADTKLKPRSNENRRDDIHEIVFTEQYEESPVQNDLSYQKYETESVIPEKIVEQPKTQPNPFDNIKIRTAHQVTLEEAEPEEHISPVAEINHKPEVAPVKMPSVQNAKVHDEIKTNAQIHEEPKTLHDSEAQKITIHKEGSEEKTHTYERPVAKMPEQDHNQILKQQAPQQGTAFKNPDQYVLPPIDRLRKGPTSGGDSDVVLKETAARLVQTLETFGVKVTITEISQGPSVTRYELQPELGVKVSKIVNLSDDIKLNLAATDIRIEAPIPGKAAIGIEVPNKENMMVALRDLFEAKEFKEFNSKIAFAVGKDIAGKTIVTDIAKMPHMLIAGSTGSGKSVCINTLIMSILYKARPDEVKLIMVDPKVVELSVYNGIPHLLIPVVTDPKKASAALHWAVSEMEDRYRKFADYNVRDLKGYNEKISNLIKSGEGENLKTLPQIVIIVDELADLMMVCPGEVEESICRLAQLARACGIHLIIATQRPSVDVITGLIKANMPSRVAFAVSSGVDSRTILDMVGAEKLLGKGDMLFYPQGYSKPARIQGAFVSDQEVYDVVDFIKNQMIGNTYAEEIEQQIMNMGSSSSGGVSGDSGSDRDELFVEAGRFIIEKDKASIGMLQRVLKIGFNRAARIMDQLCEYGVVGEEEGTKPRKILMSPEQFEQLLEEI